MKFHASRPLTLGVELELQLVDPQTGQLSDRAGELVGRVEGLNAEITQAMLEYNSPVCESARELHGRLAAARDAIVRAAGGAGLAICGGGLHPFHRWPDRQVSEGERFRLMHERYAYLMQMFTVFGQHIHIGCRDGHQALYLTHALSRFMPHLIALSASSPFYRNMDTGFDCARLNVLASFPTSGTAPWILQWRRLEHHLRRLKELHVADSMKDLYWDIRPKPDTGTIEIRVCDTPLTVREAADLAAYAQLLSCELLSCRRAALREDIYIPYRLNRFEACRYGLDGTITDPLTGSRESIRAQIQRTMERLWPLAEQLGSSDSIARLGECAGTRINGAAKLRDLVDGGATLPQVVAAQTAMWAGEQAFA